MRHRGTVWAERGYLALHVDSFGPRGYPQGFPRNSYKDRPSEANEQNVRPLDAYGALDFLRARGADVEFVTYEGAHHSYDDPGKTKQGHEPNRAATQDTLRRAEAFFHRHLQP